MTEDIFKPTRRSYREYIVFLVFQWISFLGSEIVKFAVIWWISVEVPDVTTISVASIIMFVPSLIVTPFGGVFSDRYSIKKTIIVADSLQALTTLAIIVLFVSGFGNIWIIVIANAVRGVFNAAHRPAIRAIVPIMVPSEKLDAINSFRSITRGVFLILSPILAVTCFQIWSFEQILWVDIITFGIAISSLPFISIPKKRICAKILFEYNKFLSRV